MHSPSIDVRPCMLVAISGIHFFFLYRFNIKCINFYHFEERLVYVSKKMALKIRL